MNELIAAAKGSGGRGAGYAKLKRQWTEAVWAYAKNQRVPAISGRVILEFTWHEIDRRRDPDNVAAGGRKLVLDGLVKAGVLGGDGWRYVQSWTDRFDIQPDRPGVAVQLYRYVGAVLMNP